MGSILSMQWPVSSGRTRRKPAAFNVIAGFINQARGRFAVIRGTLSHNDIMRARGHRRELVGLLQRFWKRDQRSVELWVDSLLRRAATPQRVTVRS